ncbi:MAG: hypothetical protein OEO77_10640 [Acidimicrobiia bacterium]|nr:hypothetical protein [Acidimicrobiia bacterium]MDH5616491.1 hypothetical protein [Acidimicrobiia bacterium]
MTTEWRRLVERRDVVARDIEELAEQVVEGEVDADSAEDLLVAYRQELDSLNAELKDMPGEAKTPASVASPLAQPKTRSPRRVLVGALILIIALSAAIAFAARDTTAEPELASSSPGALTVDPSSVSNEEMEAVVAANPNINAMRMALADRYFAAEEYGAALDHYLYIADNNPTPAEESKALARVGWTAYVTGLPEAAEQYVLSSLEVDPTNSEATLFLGFITLYGLEDAEAAIPQLEEALSIPGLPPDLLAQVEQALVDARQGVAP